MKRLVIVLLSLSMLFFISGCSDQEKSTSREIYSGTMWDVSAALTWNSSEVVAKVNAKYKGEKPLDYVVIKPYFNKTEWPEGYMPPNPGIYTWKAEVAGGLIPDIQETSTRSNVKLSKTAPRIMSISEANSILDKTKVDIEWKEASGEMLQTTINP